MKKLLIPFLVSIVAVVTVSAFAGVYRVKFESSDPADGVTCAASQLLTSSSADGVAGAELFDVTIYDGTMPTTCTVSRVSADAKLTNNIVVVHALVAGAPVSSNLVSRCMISSGDSILITAGDTNTPFKAQIVVSTP